MHTTLFAVAIAAAGVAAIAAPGPEITQAPALNARAFDQVQYRVVDPSFTPGNEKESDCLDESLFSLSQGIPAPSGKLLDWITASMSDGDYETITDIGQAESYCSNTNGPISHPASLSSAFSSWKSEVIDWQKEIREEAYSLSKECGAAGPFFEGLVATDPAECRKAVSSMFAAATPTLTESEGAGPRETGFVAAAAAFAGVAGVFAAM